LKFDAHNCRIHRFVSTMSQLGQKIVLNMSDPTPEIAKSDSPADSNSTVKFNVGGRHYEVSRSLIEWFPDTMLAKMVSETWQKDPEATLFIDENGDRFQYCLDYIRRNEVWIPLSVPKEALLRDLDYYGFEDVDPSKIHAGSSYMEAAQSLLKCKEEHDNFLLTCKENVKAAETTSKCEQLAYACFVRFSRGDSLEIYFSSKREPELCSSIAKVAVAVGNQAVFQDRLAKYGLALVEVQYVSISKLGFSTIYNSSGMPIAGTCKGGNNGYRLILKVKKDTIN
jgi:hypothetical protein